MEEWRSVPGWEGLYDVSDQGRVRGYLGGRGKLLTIPRLRKDHVQEKTGYRHLKLKRAGVEKQFYVHVLVLLAFKGPQPEGMEGAHDNGVPGDCQLLNLRWDTRKGNHADKHRHGTALIGDKANRSALVEAQVRQIRAGGMSDRAFAKLFGVDKSSVWAVRHRKSWRHLA